MVPRWQESWRWEQPQLPPGGVPEEGVAFGALGGGPWYGGKGGKLSDDRSMSGINLVEIRPVTPATKGN